MLANIFNNITPDNIKDIPLIEDAMSIFIETLEEKAKISKDISNIFNQENQAIRNEFIKIYLDDMKRYFTKAESNKIITDKIEEINSIFNLEIVKKDFIGNIVDLLDDEHFITSKAFKQKKGTSVAIEYIYNIVEQLAYGVAESGSFKFIEGDEPFQFTVEGAIYKEMYDQIVKPLAHPLGFTYVYLQIVKLSLQDQYQIDYVYENKVTEVRCLDGRVESYSHLGITNIFEGFDGIKRILKVYFEDGTYLKQTVDPIIVTLHNNDSGDPEVDGSIIKTYSGHCSIFLDYIRDVKILTTDSVQWEVSKGLEDKYEEDEYLMPVIGPDMVIGRFTIGTTSSHLVKDEMYFTIDFDFDRGINQAYQVMRDYLGFRVGTSNVGGALIGVGYETVYADTTEVYDISSETYAQDDFTFEIIPS